MRMLKYLILADRIHPYEHPLIHELNTAQIEHWRPQDGYPKELQHGIEEFMSWILSIKWRDSL